MPKLLALLVCEKVIVDSQQVPSLIGVFQRVNVQLLDTPVPPNALTPMRWAIFALWQHTPDERGKEFVQLSQVTKPNGEKFFDLRQPFKLLADAEFLQSKNTVEIFGVPIEQEGDITVRVWIEGNEQDATTFPFSVKHQKKESDATATASASKPN